MISKWNFTNVIKIIPTYVGCNDFPQGAQGEQLKAIISEFINEQFPLLKPDDITEAFKLSAAGKLFDNGKKIEPNTYGQLLSAALVGRVLSAYVDYKKDARSRPSGYNFKQLGEATPSKITPQEAYSLIIKWVKEDGEFPMVAPYRSCYLYLLEKGVVKEIEPPKSRGRFSQMIGAVMDANPYRIVVQEYLTKNL
jgi:hypothetical protein